MPLVRGMSYYDKEKLYSQEFAKNLTKMKPKNVTPMLLINTTPHMDDLMMSIPKMYRNKAAWLL